MSIKNSCYIIRLYSSKSQFLALLLCCKICTVACVYRATLWTLEVFWRWHFKQTRTARTSGWLPSSWSQRTMNMNERGDCFTAPEPAPPLLAYVIHLVMFKTQFKAATSTWILPNTLHWVIFITWILTDFYFLFVLVMYVYLATPAIADVWVGWSVVSVTLCMFVLVCVLALKEKRRELSTANSVCIQCMAVDWHALTLRLEGQGCVVIKSVAGMGMQVDMTA